jgi:hypothetical protein
LTLRGPLRILSIIIAVSADIRNGYLPNTVLELALLFHELALFSSGGGNGGYLTQQLKTDCFNVHEQFKDLMLSDFPRSLLVWKDSGLRLLSFWYEQFTGRFIMFSVITKIYNKKTKGPIP